MKEEAWGRFWDAWCRTPRPWLTPEIEDRVKDNMRQAWVNGHDNGTVDAQNDDGRQGRKAVELAYEQGYISGQGLKG